MFSYTYNAASELVEVSDPDSTYKYTYDLDGRMLTVDNAGTPGVPTTIMTYTYDNVGNMLSMRDTNEQSSRYANGGTTGVTTGYQYDALDRNTRLTQGNKRVDYSYNPIVTHEEYTYDRNGNRINTGYVTGVNNRLLEDSKYRYTYDAIGRRTNKTDKTTNETTEYTWDFGYLLTLH